MSRNGKGRAILQCARGVAVTFVHLGHCFFVVTLENHRHFYGVTTTIMHMLGSGMECAQATHPLYDIPSYPVTAGGSGIVLKIIGATLGRI